MCSKNYAHQIIEASDYPLTDDSYIHQNVEATHRPINCLNSLFQRLLFDNHLGALYTRIQHAFRLKL